MLSPLALLNGIDRSMTLATSALPHAPTVGACEVREVRRHSARARETILSSR